MSNKLQNKPLVGLDFLRFFAVLCVILTHVTEAIYTLNLEAMGENTPLSAGIALGFFTLGRMGVPCFLVLTGFLLMNRTYSREQGTRFLKSNWLHLLICTWVWFSLYDGFLVLRGVEITPLQYLRHMLFLEKVPMSHVWYMPVILGLYLLIPVMANGLKTMGSRQLLPVLGVLFACCFLVPAVNTVLGALGEKKLSAQFSAGFSGGAYGMYLLLGAGVARGMLRKIKAPVLIFAVLFSYGATLWFQLWCYGRGYKYNVWYDFPTLPVVGVCLVELFSRVRVLPAAGVLRQLSRYAFGVYLTHNLLLQLVAGSAGTWGLPRSGVVAVLTVLLGIGSYLLCFALGAVPGVGKYLLYIKPQRRE